MKTKQIIDAATLNFEELTHWHLKLKEFVDHANDDGIDAIIELSDDKRKNKKIIVAECKTEVRRNDFAKFIERKRKHENYFIITQYISKPDREFLREQGINYLESSGNCFLKDTNTFIFIDNQKVQPYRQSTSFKIFTDSSMRLAYAILLEPWLINESYRTISKRAEVSLGNVGTVLEALGEADLLKTKNSGRIIADPSKLFETWATHYGTTMRPHLFQRRLAFTDKTMKNNWKDIDLKNDFWGGEPAANLLDHYLSPEIFTLYTNKKLHEVMKIYKLFPDEVNGTVLYMLPPFKNREESKEKADPFLIYAELIQSKDSRCLEAAQRIKKKYIEPKLKNIQ